MIVGFPGRDRRRLRARIWHYLPTSPLTHLHVFPYSDRPGTDATRHARQGCTASSIRERGCELRAHRRRRSRGGFRDAQVGTVRPGLTLEDGTLVVTDNYLKVRIPGRRDLPRYDQRVHACGPCRWSGVGDARRGRALLEGQRCISVASRWPGACWSRPIR